MRGPDGRYRAGWRILFFVGVFYAFALVATLVRQAVLTVFGPSQAVAVGLTGFLIVLVATPAVLIARRKFDHKSFRSLGLEARGRFTETIYGFVVAAVAASLSIAILWMAGFADLTFVGISAIELFLLFVGTAAGIAWFEELVFRGYLLQNLIEGLGVRRAVVISVLVSTLVHVFNPHASAASTFIIGGIVALHVYAYLRTRRLWLTLGLHAGWNFFQGAVWGLPASGRTTASLVETTLNGPAWLTGREFGMEASVFGVFYAALGALAVWIWCRRPRL